MGLFSFVGGLLGAGSAKKASKKAEREKIAYLQKAIDEEARQYDQSRTDFAPYREVGTDALARIRTLMGLGGGFSGVPGGAPGGVISEAGAVDGGASAQAAAIEALKQQPLYKSLFRTGEEEILQTAAATGGLRGGDTSRSLADFGADTLLKTLIQELSGLGGLASLGVGATGSTAALGAQKANAIAEILGQQGNTRSDGILTRGGITNAMWNSAGGFADSIASAFAGGFGGGGGLSGGLKAIGGKLF